MEGDEKPHAPEGNPCDGSESPRREDPSRERSSFTTPVNNSATAPSDPHTLERLERQLEGRLDRGVEGSEERLQAELSMIHKMNSERAIQLLRARGVLTPRDGEDPPGQLEREINALREMSERTQEQLLASLVAAQQDAMQSQRLTEQLRLQLERDSAELEELKRELVWQQATHNAAARDKAEEMLTLSKTVHQLRLEKQHELAAANQERQRLVAQGEQERAAGMQVREEVRELQIAVEGARGELMRERRVVHEQREELVRLQQSASIDKEQWNQGILKSQQELSEAEASVAVLQAMLQEVGDALKEEVAQGAAESNQCQVLKARVTELEQSLLIEESRVELEREMTDQLMRAGQEELGDQILYIKRR